MSSIPVPFYITVLTTQDAKSKLRVKKEQAKNFRRGSV
jgi:hypothetical protein